MSEIIAYIMGIIANKGVAFAIGYTTGMIITLIINEICDNLYGFEKTKKRSKKK